MDASNYMNTANNQIRLSADGVWYQGDEEITHKRTVELFFKNIYCEGGEFFLKGDKKPVPVVVDDAPYFVKSIDKNGAGFVIGLSDQQNEILDITTLHVGSNHEFYCRVKDKTCRAKFERKVYYHLMKYLDERDGYYGLLVDGIFYPVQSEYNNKAYEEHLKKQAEKPKVVPAPKTQSVAAKADTKKTKEIKPASKVKTKQNNSLPQKQLKKKKAPAKQKIKVNKKAASKKKTVVKKKPVKKTAAKKKLIKKKMK